MQPGSKNFDAIAWYGDSVAGRTPRPIVNGLNAEIRGILKQPDTKQRLFGEGLDVVTSLSQDFDCFVAPETMKMARVIK